MKKSVLNEAVEETWSIDDLEPFMVPSDEQGDGEPGEQTDDDIDTNDKTEDDLNDSADKVTADMDKSKDLDDKEADDKEAKKPQASQRGAPQDGQQGKNPEPTEFDYTKAEPRHSWASLLNKLVTDTSNQTEDSYQRVNRRNITGMHTAQQTGMGNIKPGEIELDAKIKLAFIVDSSGSMTSDIAKIYSNMMNLLKKHRAALNGDFFLIKFSDDFNVYRANFASGRYVEIDNVDSPKKDMGSGNLQTLFSQHFGSSTNFSAALVTQAEKLVAKNYNVILLTDTDICAPRNTENLLKLYKNAKKQLYVIAADKENYVAILQAIDQVSNNITYLT